MAMRLPPAASLSPASPTPTTTPCFLAMLGAGFTEVQKRCSAGFHDFDELANFGKARGKYFDARCVEPLPCAAPDSRTHDRRHACFAQDVDMMARTSSR